LRGALEARDVNHKTLILYNFITEVSGSILLLLYRAVCVHAMGLLKGIEACCKEIKLQRIYSEIILFDLLRGKTLSSFVVCEAR
jgi:hypothetical protein